MASVFAALLLATLPVRAQIVADGATNTLSNVTNFFPGNVTIGTNGSFTLLILSDHALLTNSANGTIGQNPTARSNEVRLVSPTARWEVGGAQFGTQLYLGSNGPFNRLVVSNGASVRDFGAVVGQNASSSNNVALVTGSGSVWSHAGFLGFLFTVGANGAGNQLVVSNGGSLRNEVDCHIGVNSASSNNLAVVTGPGSTWTNADNLSVGSGGAGNQLLVNNGGAMWNRNGYVGETATAGNNLALVTGSGSVWSNALDLTVGLSGPGNQLVVSNGATAFAGGNGVIGFNSGANLNSAVVTDVGTRWLVATNLYVGTNSAFNTLVVSKGGLVADNSGFIGYGSASSNNVALVTGSGSVWSNASIFGFYVGVNGGANQLVVSNGGMVRDGGFVSMGANPSSSSNVAVVTDSGSVWDTAGILYAGFSGAGNRLVVTNGGVVRDGSGYISANSSSSNNVAVVTGSGSVWSNTFELRVGSFGRANQLVVSNSGLVFAEEAVSVGFDVNSTMNRLVVDGGTLRVTNATGTGVLDVRRGTNVLNAGLIDVDQLVMTTTGTNVVPTGYGNSGSISIPTGGTATPYPSTIAVSGLAGAIIKVTATLSNLSHTFPQDLRILLVSPAGQSVMLMSHAGGGTLTNGISNVRLTFDDAASTPIPGSGTIATGTYRPADYQPGVNMPAPAPAAAPYSVFLSNLNGGSPIGTWKLFINDDANPDSGSLVGWGLQIETDASLVLDRGYFDFNGGTLITRGAVISNGLSFVVGTSGTTPAVWDVRSGVTNTSISGDLTIGDNASFNQLILTNGALLTNSGNSGYGWLGRQFGANSNSATLAGASSKWRLDGGVLLGYFGSSSRLVVSNGAALVTGGYSSIGNQFLSTNNEAVVTGPGSSWTSGLGQLYVGAGGRDNRLLVSDGALVVSYAGTIGDSFADSSNNLALVTGAGSSWSNALDLRVGGIGAANTLVVSNSGTVFAPSAVYVGFDPASLRNRLVVDGGTLRTTNASATAVLDVRRGTNVLNAGLIQADTLRLTNTLGFFEFNGGTLSSKSSTVSNGQLFRVGNGVSPATLTLAGNGSHSFVGGLTVSTNGTLTGNGSLSGAFTVQAGGLLSPGMSIGNILSVNSPLLQGAVLMEISRNGGTLANDQLQVIGPLSYGGTLAVSNIGPDTLVAGSHFQLFSATSYAGSFSAITLPPLGPGLNWTNRLLLDGSFEIIGPPAILISSGTYRQNFDSLASGGGTAAWRDNFTLVGWYAAQSLAPFQIITYRISNGGDNTGALYSFGGPSAPERALGSIAADAVGHIAYGLCFSNDTANTVSNFTIAYTGEQWRNGGSPNTNTLTFWYRVSASALTNPEPETATGWTEVTNLDFASPIVSGFASSLDGNASANRHIFTGIPAPSLVLTPGQCVFLRWRDLNDPGSDQGLAVDNLTVWFLPTPPQLTAVSLNATNGFPQISGAGVPNVTYCIQAATNLAPPIFWQRIGSNTADGAGLFHFTDTNAPAFPVRFYRALSP